MRWFWFFLLSAALASIVARATGDEAAARWIAYAVLGSAVFQLVVVAIMAPSLYRDVWRMIQPDSIAAALDRFAKTPPDKE